MPQCILINCTSDSKKLNKSMGITFHRFPKDDRKEEWTEFVRNNRGDPFWKPKKESVYICSLHFKDKDKHTTGAGRVFLTKTAMPSHPKSKADPNPIVQTQISRVKQELFKAKLQIASLRDTIKKRQYKVRMFAKRCMEFRELNKKLKRQLKLCECKHMHQILKEEDLEISSDDDRDLKNDEDGMDEPMAGVEESDEVKPKTIETKPIVNVKQEITVEVEVVPEYTEVKKEIEDTKETTYD